MSTEILNTPLGWVVLALVFGAVPIYLAFKTRDFFSHIPPHLSEHSTRLVKGPEMSEPVVRVVNVARK
jgi:hypothetical protein